MPFEPPVIASTPWQLQQLGNAMSQAGNAENGYSWGGQLWRNLLTGLSGGAVDVMGISQHNRDIKANGGTPGNAILSGLGSALTAFQEQFLNSNGQTKGALNNLRAGVISEYIKKYLPWVVLGLGVVVGGMVLLFRKKRR